MTVARRRTRIALLVNFLDSAYQMSLRTAIGRVAARRGIDLWVAIGRELEHQARSERALNCVYRWLTPQSVDGAIVIAGALSNYVGTLGVAALCRDLAPVNPHAAETARSVRRRPAPRRTPGARVRRPPRRGDRC